MSTNRKYVQAQYFTFAGAGVVIGNTTAVLSSLKDIDGNTLAMTDFGTAGYMTAEPNNSSQEEGFVFTGITQNANGTATLTGVSSVLLKYPYTQTSGFLKNHAGGTKCIITNTAGFYNDFGNKYNDETVSGQWTFTVFPITPSNSDASTTVKGVSKLSTAPVLSTNPIAVGDNDVRVPLADPTTLFAPLSGASSFAYGDGSDGAATFADQGTAQTGTTKTDNTAGATIFQLSRDVYYTNITINSTVTLVTNGYKIFWNGTSAGAGTIKATDGAAGSSGSGSVGGAGGVAYTTGGYLTNAAGGAGGAGGVFNGAGSGAGAAGATIPAFDTATAGSAGGAGNPASTTGGDRTGGTAGAGSLITYNSKYGKSLLTTLQVSDYSFSTPFIVFRKAAAGGGGGGGGVLSNSSGFGGGGGGASGGIVFLCGNVWGGTFTIKAVGGAGGGGANGTNVGGTQYAGAGGAGGNGGVAIVIYGSKTWTGSYALTGGAAGTTGGTNPSNSGNAGSTGTSYEILSTALKLF